MTSSWPSELLPRIRPWTGQGCAPCAKPAGGKAWLLYTWERVRGPFKPVCEGCLARHCRSPRGLFRLATKRYTHVYSSMLECITCPERHVAVTPYRFRLLRGRSLRGTPVRLLRPLGRRKTGLQVDLQCANVTNINTALSNQIIFHRHTLHLVPPIRGGSSAVHSAQRLPWLGLGRPFQSAH